MKATNATEKMWCSKQLDRMKSSVHLLGIVEVHVIVSEGTPAERTWLRESLRREMALAERPYLPSKHRGWR